MVCGEVLICSMSQEHFESPVDMGDPACPFDGRWCADIHAKLFPYLIELSLGLSAEVVGLPHEMQKIVHLAHHWFFLLEQGWATGGPRAACGPRVEFVRPASSFVYIIGFSVVI